MAIFFRLKKCAPPLVFFLGACSSHEDSANAPRYELRLGSHVLFSLNAWGELIETPSPLQNSLEKTFPKLTFSVENRIVAELGVSDGNILPPVATNQYSAQSECFVGPVLQKTKDALARIALSKDIQTQIPAHFETLSSCQTAKTLECFLNEIGARDWNDLPTAAARGLTLRGIVAKLGTCSGSDAASGTARDTKNPWKTKNHFTIAGGKIYFYPSPVVQIFVFEDEHSVYSSALGNSDTHMKTRSGLCLENCFDTAMPLGVLTPSISGNALEKGKTYTAFLQLTQSQADNVMVPVVFVAP
jgi:hypothetical protein